MSGLQKKEEMVFKIVAVLLIFVVSAQLMLKEERTRNALKNFEAYLQSYVSRPVFLTEEMGYIQMRLINGNNQQVKVLLNNRIAGDFYSGRVRIYVKEGDYLAVDAGETGKTIKIEIEKVSPGIVSFREGEIILIPGNRTELGRIGFETRI